jgi:hypothetical protein
VVTGGSAYSEETDAGVAAAVDERIEVVSEVANTGGRGGVASLDV